MKALRRAIRRGRRLRMAEMDAADPQPKVFLVANYDQESYAILGVFAEFAEALRFAESLQPRVRAGKEYDWETVTETAGEYELFDGNIEVTAAILGEEHPPRVVWRWSYYDEEQKEAADG